MWSNRVTCADGFAAGKGVTFGFDGDTSTECEMSATAFANQTPIVYTGTHSNVTSFSLTFAGKLYFNGSSDQAVDPDGNLTQNNGYYPIASVAAPSTITSIEIYPYGTAHAGGVRTIEINGKTIVDQGIPGAPGEAKVISKDDSDPYTITVDGGNWTDGNSNITGDFVTGQSAQGEPDITDGKGFDGNNTTAIRPTNADLEFYWDWPQGVKVNSTIRVHSNGGDDEGVGSGMVAGTMPITINKGRPDEATLVLNSTVAGINDVDPTPYVDFSFTGTLYSVYITPSSENTGNPKNYAHLSAIIVDGRYLVQGPDADDKLVKETPYAAKLTVASSENLELLTGDVFMTDGSDTPATQTPYKLVTTDIESANQDDYTSGLSTNKRPGDISPFEGPIDDLKDSSGYFKVAYFDVNVTGSWTAPEGGVGTNEVVVYTYFYENASMRIIGGGKDVTINPQRSADGVDESFEGGEITTTIFTDGVNIDETYVTIGSSFLPLEKIEVLTTQASRASYIKPIFVDGTRIIDSNVTLTFPGDVSTNPDLQYFRRDDLVQDTGSNITADLLVRSSASTTGLNSHFGTASDIPGWIDAYNEIIPAGNDPDKQYYFNEITDKPPVKCIFGWQMFKLPSPRSSMTFTRSSASGALYVYGSASGNDGTWTLIDTNAGGDDDFTVTNDSAITYWALSFLSGDASTNSHHLGADGVGAKVISTGYPDSNTMVVDGGNWDTSNQSQVWSAGGSGQPQVIGDLTWSWDKAFNGFVTGDPSAAPTLSAMPEAADYPLGTNGIMEWSGSIDTSNVTTVTLYYWNQGANSSTSGNYISINGTEVSGLIDSGAGTLVISTIDITALAGDAITAMKINRPVGTNNPIAIVGIALDGKLLVDQGIRDLGDSRVEYQTNGGEGSIIEVNTDDNTLLVTNSGDSDNRWIAENNAGTDFYVAPADAVPISQDYAWGKLQIINNKAQVTGIQKDDPGYLPVPAKDYSIKFPAVFPTGNEPDADLPRGACVAAIVAAENSEGRSVKESNCFMPLDVNPDGAAGPITDSTPTTLTVASNANLSDFSPGDNLVMVNEDNEISSYTMQTSEIESVSTNSYSVAPGGNARANIGNMFDGDTSTNAECDIGTTNILFDEPIPGVTKIEYYTLWNNNRVDASPANNHKLGYNANVNNDAIFYQNDSPTGWYTAYEGAPIDFTGVYFEVVNNGLNSQGCYAIRVNGTVLDLNNRVVLTFAGDVSTNPDLKFFQPGDVVQTENPWNQDKEWATHLTSSNGWAGSAYEAKKAFDGNSSTHAGSASGGTLTFNPYYEVPANSVIEGWFGDTDAQLMDVTVNGVLNREVPGGDWRVVNYDNSTTFEVMTITRSNGVSNSADLRRLRINGKELVDNIIVDDTAVKVISTGYPDSNTMVVDGGEWDTSNQSQDWSSICTYVNGNLNRPLSLFFDGQLNLPLYADGQRRATITFPSVVPAAVGEIYGQLNGATDPQWRLEVNDVPVIQGNDNGWTSINTALAAQGGLKTISFGDDAYGIYPAVYGVRLDGKLLVDKGIDVLGDSEVTYGPVTGTGTFQSADLAANTITMSVSNDRWIDNTNRLGIDFYCRDNITVLNADNPKHVAMQQAIAAAFDAFPEKVNERRTSIASSFYRLMEGETLSAADYSLLEETVLDAVNAQEPFALNGFYPLYYTSAKADAASSADSHHSHTIAGVTYYMPDGGTLYHGNYIAPETATTDTNDSSSSSHNHGSGSSY